MAGVILLTTMVAEGISLWLKKRRAKNDLEEKNDEFGGNSQKY